MEQNIQNKQNKEFDKNRSELKKCTHLYNTATKIYAVMYGFYALADIFILIMNLVQYPAYPFLDAVFKISALVLSYRSVYKKENVFVIIATAVMFINTLLVNSHFYAFDALGIISDFNPVVLFISVLLTVLVIITNNKYNYLSQQVGFPYFSERAEQQKSDRIQFNIKNKFRQQSEEWEKTATDSMETVGYSTPSVPPPPQPEPEITDNPDDVRTDDFMQSVDFSSSARSLDLTGKEEK